MKIRIERLPLVKRHPLTISRGTSAGSENLLITVEAEGVIGQGEMAPTSGGAVSETAESAEAVIQTWIEPLERVSPWQMQQIEEIWQGEGRFAARAALDIALHDWHGRRVGQPLWRLFGLDPARIVPTSVTVGINPPELVLERVQEILARTGALALKVKLGNPAGIEADQAQFVAAQKAARTAGRTVAWRVDANGGWSVEDARTMLRWLAERGVEFVEQPLARGREDDLPALYRDRPLPLYADESVYVASDIPRLADRVDGVNLKLMKCGGLREALRIFHTARAHGLKVMMGCMSESSLAITAAAHLSPLADALDLDSHLNLLPDPFTGAALIAGRVAPTGAPGLGVHRSEAR